MPESLVKKMGKIRCLWISNLQYSLFRGPSFAASRGFKQYGQGTCFSPSFAFGGFGYSNESPGGDEDELTVDDSAGLTGSKTFLSATACGFGLDALVPALDGEVTLWGLRSLT
jgi:hypothetical protein